MIVGRTLPPRLFCAALLVCAGAPAAAQYGSAPAPAPPPPMPSSGSSRDDAPIVPATAVQLQAGAACLIGRNPAAADALLATAPYSSQERQQAMRLIGEIPRCQRQRQPISTSAAQLRGALAEAVYEARFTAPQAAASPAVRVKPLFQPERVTGSVDAAARASEYALAECAAAQHPELVIGLLQTEPSTPAAQTAFQALNPAFSGCVISSAPITVDGRTIRGILAEGLYRWSVVQRDGAGSPLAAAPAPATTAAATPASQ